MAALFYPVEYLSINVSCLHNSFEVNGVRYLYEFFKISLQTARAKKLFSQQTLCGKLKNHQSNLLSKFQWLYASHTTR